MLIEKIFKKGELEIIGSFNDLIFDIYPSKVEEIMDFLTGLLTEKKGKFRLEVDGDNFVSLCANNSKPLMHTGESRNAYGTAFHFLKGENVAAYLARH